MASSYTCPDCRQTVPFKGALSAEAKTDHKCTRPIPTVAKDSAKQMATLRRDNCKRGRREDCGNIYFPCAMEANIYRWLRWQKEKGLIDSFEYQPKEFDFSDTYKHGTNRYRADFCFVFTHGDMGYSKYVEVKGYLDAKSQTKLKRMKKLYPLENIEIIGTSRKVEAFAKSLHYSYSDYREITREYAKFIPGWE